MAIQVSGTEVISNSRVLSNVTGLKTVGGTSILGSGDIAVGGSTTYGAVGTYVGGYVNNVGFVDNNTNKSGSSIQIYNGSTGYGHSLNSGNQAATATKSASLSGTWRCVSSYGQNSSSYYWGAIWFRIS
jgi:hypothetical protein